jgi:hypothetical protein
MSKYSSFFLIGNAKYENLSSKLRLRKYGSWLAEEAWTREEASQKQAQFTLKAVELARKIANEKSISEDEAFQALSSNLSGDDEFFGQYASEVSGLMSALPSGREQFEKLVTIFFRNRGEVLVGKKWEATAEWSKEDTKLLPKPILRKIESFMAEEETEIANEDEPEELNDEEASEKN